MCSRCFPPRPSCTLKSKLSGISRCFPPPPRGGKSGEGGHKWAKSRSCALITCALIALIFRTMQRGLWKNLSGASIHVIHVINVSLRQFDCSECVFVKYAHNILRYLTNPPLSSCLPDAGVARSRPVSVSFIALLLLLLLLPHHLNASSQSQQQISHQKGASNASKGCIQCMRCFSCVREL